MFKIFLAVILFFGLLSFVFTVASIAEAQQQPRPPVNWQPIIGSKVPGGKLFIDANSLKTNQEDNGKYNTAEILISYDLDTELNVGTTKHVVKSIVKSLVIECGTGLMAPVLDLYFTHPKPLRNTKPITGLNYPTDVSSTAIVLRKNTALYHALCPTYI